MTSHRCDDDPYSFNGPWVGPPTAGDKPPLTSMKSLGAMWVRMSTRTMKGFVLLGTNLVTVLGKGWK